MAPVNKAAVLALIALVACAAWLLWGRTSSQGPSPAEDGSYGKAAADTIERAREAQRESEERQRALDEEMRRAGRRP